MCTIIGLPATGPDWVEEISGALEHQLSYLLIRYRSLNTLKRWLRPVKCAGDWLNEHSFVSSGMTWLSNRSSKSWRSRIQGREPAGAESFSSMVGGKR
jgi:hypothetical protein